VNKIPNGYEGIFSKRKKIYQIKKKDISNERKKIYKIKKIWKSGGKKF
jgi:hypothetical protein